MFDIGAGEILVIVIVAIIFIGPKELPLALRTAGRWIGKIRRASNHFRTGIEAMIREAEMEEMDKKWRAQNEKIMAEYPSDPGTGHDVDPAPPMQPLAPPGAAIAPVEHETGTGEEPSLPFGGRKQDG